MYIQHLRSLRLFAVAAMLVLGSPFAMRGEDRPGNVGLGTQQALEAVQGIAAELLPFTVSVQRFEAYVESAEDEGDFELVLETTLAADEKRRYIIERRLDSDRGKRDETVRIYDGVHLSVLTNGRIGELHTIETTRRYRGSRFDSLYLRAAGIFLEDPTEAPDIAGLRILSFPVHYLQARTAVLGQRPPASDGLMHMSFANELGGVPFTENIGFSLHPTPHIAFLQRVRHPTGEAATYHCSQFKELRPGVLLPTLIIATWPSHNKEKEGTLTKVRLVVTDLKPTVDDLLFNISFPAGSMVANVAVSPDPANPQIVYASDDGTLVEVPAAGAP